MRVALVVAACAAASAAVPAGAVTVYIAPATQSFLVSSTGYSFTCPPGAAYPIGCSFTQGVSRQFTLFDGFSIDIPVLNGTYGYGFGGGAGSDYFTYSGSLTFNNGVLVSNAFNITEDGQDNRGTELFFDTHGFHQEGRYVGVAVRLADGTVIRAIPEPATWAMMIAGFAMAGAALRRRARALPTAPDAIAA